MATESSCSVAVIGAGISGINTAAHLIAAGVKTTVFERSAEAGGVWYGN
jgi:MFS transporter, ACS family, pantothenate transporter